MANSDAWDLGWEQGSKAANKSNANKKKKTSNKDGGSSGSTGGNPWSILSYLPKLRRGGKITKTGYAVLHKGEEVIRAKHRSRKRAGTKKTVIKA